MSKATKTIVIALSLVAIIALSFGAGHALGTRTHPSLAPGLDSVAEAWDTILAIMWTRTGLIPAH